MFTQKKDVLDGASSFGVDHYFNDEAYVGAGGSLAIQQLPFLGRKLAEHIHDVDPAVVIAGDRGARLIGLATIIGWSRRFPEERFPTIESKLHFARVTSRSAGRADVLEAVRSTLIRAGLPEQFSYKRKQDGDSPKVVYIDDWAVRGGTAKRFIRAAMGFGIPGGAISYSTAVGHYVRDLPGGVKHFIADPSRNPRWSCWDTHDAADYCTQIGVRYSCEDPTVPIADVTEVSKDARRQLVREIDRYYRKFTLAHAAGEIATSAKPV